MESNGGAVDDAPVRRLPGSVLLTSEAHTHTAYLFKDPCIDDPVNAYLVAGTLPAAGIRCPTPLPRALPLLTRGARAFLIEQRPWSQPHRGLPR